MNDAKLAKPGKKVLEVHALEKDFFTIQRIDAPARLRLLHYCLGWAGAYRESERLFEPRPVLRGVDLEVYENEILAITGKSGAGKSTLLNLLGALDRPSRGRIAYRGQDLSTMTGHELSRFRNENIGFVFQFYHLFEDLDAQENVLLPAMVLPGYKSRLKEHRERALELLDRVGLSERLSHRPSQLSGGEQQRVAIARALMLRPEILLCDEPTGNLDGETAASILELLFDLQKMEQRTYVIVTHDSEVAELADRHVIMRDGVVSA